MTDPLPQDDAPLTYQQRRVLELAAHGLDAYTIAWHLRISRRTVHTYTAAIRRALGVPTTTAAVGLWRQSHAPDPAIAGAVARRRRLPPLPAPPPLTPAARFAQSCVVTGTGHHHWTGPAVGGLPVLRLGDGSMGSARRFALQQAQMLPPGHVATACPDDPLCVNPDPAHLGSVPRRSAHV